MINSEWDVVRVFQAANSAAKRNDFCLDVYADGAEQQVAIVAFSHPYANEVVLATCDTFKEALKWLEGYEQHKWELKNT